MSHTGDREARPTAQGVSSEVALRREARPTAQAVRVEATQREPGGKWGGRLAPPIEHAPSQREPGGKWGGRLAPPIQQ